MRKFYTLFFFSFILLINVVKANEFLPCDAQIITQDQQEVCDNIFMVSAQDPEANETGLWTGPGMTSFVDETASSTFITNLNPGPNVITWSILDAGGNICDSKSITLVNNQVITTPLITTPNNLEVCDENDFQIAANTNLKPGEVGTWSSNIPSVTFAPNVNNPNAIANNLAPGNNGISWNIEKEGCSANPAFITVNNNEVITEPEIEPSSVLVSCETDGFGRMFANLTNQLIPGEIGTWTGPPGVTFSPNSESPTINGLLPGENILTWTISRGNCPTKSISITLINNMVMTDAEIFTAAQEVCDENNFSIEGNTPANGETGTWSGPAGVTFADPNNPSTTINGLQSGDNEICWTISRGDCPPSQACVIITNNEVTTNSTISTADGQEVCDENGFMISANAPANGETGTWNGPAGVTFAPNANAPNATANGLPSGTSTLCWTITRGGCDDTASEACIDVTNNEVNTESVISTTDGQEVCDENGFMISANAPANGETGTWNGPAGVTFAPNANAPNATANGLPSGTSTLCWTITRGGCDDTASEACIDVTNNEVTTNSTTSTADGQEVCDENGFMVSANAPANGETGTWNGPAGVTFAPNANAPNATANGLPSGTSTLCWTITRGGCDDTASEACIDVTNNEVTSVSAIATADGQEVCDEDNFSADANVPANGETGTWSGPSGVTFSPNANTPSVVVNDLPTGTSTLCWTITRGGCDDTASESCIDVTNNEVLTQAAVATASGQETCDSDAFMVEGNAPQGNETGTWSGPTGVTFDPNANSPTATVIGLPLGTSTLTWTISNGDCPATSAEIAVLNNEPTQPNISTSGGQAICDIESFTLQANTPASGETGVWTGPTGVIYLPNINSPTVTVSNLPPGNNDFTWTITQGGCSLSDVVTLTTYSTPVSTTTVSDVTIVEGNDGEIAICVNGGTSPYNVTWMPNEGDLAPVSGSCDANFEITGLTEDVYTIYIQDANGCADTIPNIAVSGPVCDDFNIGLVTEVGETCNDTQDGSITIEVLGAQGDITYSIGNGIPDVITSDNPYTFTDLPAGSYNLFVQDERLCPDSYISNPVIVTEPNSLTVTTNVTDLGTIGGADGAVCVTVEGGTSPYTVTSDCGTVMSGAGSCGGDFHIPNLADVTCEITIVDATGECTVMTSATVSPPTCDLSINGDPIISEVNCFDGSDGSITVNASSMGGGIQYSIDGGKTFMTGASPFVFDNLSAGTYNLILEDALNCTTSYSNNPIVLNNPAELLVTTDTTRTTTVGGNDGIIDICINGGTPNFTIEYTPNTGFLTSVSGNCDANFQILGLIEGEYDITITDANNCVFNITETVEGPDCSSFTIGEVTTQNEACNDSDDGSITIEVLGAIGEITYSVGNGVADIVTNTNPYTFDNLPEGEYIVFVVDEVGCSNSYISNPVIITAPDALALGANLTNVSVLGGSDGEIEINVTGGTGPFTATINGGSQMTSPNGNFVFGGLGAGEYEIVVTDANGCEITTTQTLNDPSCILEVGNVMSTATSCNGFSDGTITITATSDNPPIEYSIDGINFQTSNVFSGLPSGEYNIVIKDAVACLASFSSNPVIVSEPEVFDVLPTILNVTTLGGSNGRIILCINGGTPDYTVTIDPPAGTVTETMGSCDADFEITDLSIGEYTVTIADANGCEVVIDAPIEEPDCDDFMVEAVNPMDNNCNVSSQSNPDPDGTIEIIVTGGEPPYDYSIFGGANPTKFADTSYLFTGLNVGTYTILVTDASGCAVGFAETIDIGEPELLVSPPTIIEPSVVGGSDGEICLSPSGGIPPYIVTASCGTVVEGSGPQCGGDFYITGLSAGQCDILVVDANLCEASGTITMMDPPCDQFGISAVNSNDACNGQSDGEITINIMGGTPPYLYSVDGGMTTESSSDMSFTFTGLGAGAYDIFVSDMVLCTEDYADQIVIEELPEFEVDAGADEIIEIGESVDLSATSSEMGEYEWTPADNLDDPFSANPTATPTDVGEITYQVTLTTPEGCTATDEVTITVEDNSIIVVPTGFTPNGDGENDEFFPYIDGNVDVLSFTVWNRWGEKVHDDPNAGWDGTYKGTDQPLSSFVYVLEYQLPGKSPEVLKGDFVLIR